MRELFADETHNVAGGYGYPNSYGYSNSYSAPYGSPKIPTFNLQKIRNGIQVGTAALEFVGQGVNTYNAIRNSQNGYQ
ncbi:hypothetical protein [Serratia marcescens]|uniref:hypothetical protein n=1 Tax=Serratia marcescens TaxID=615 RepID=UPI003FA727C2|nr:hypothetical protein [Serratia marcescens]